MEVVFDKELTIDNTEIDYTVGAYTIHAVNKANEMEEVLFDGYISNDQQLSLADFRPNMKIRFQIVKRTTEDVPSDVKEDQSHIMFEGLFVSEGFAKSVDKKDYFILNFMDFVPQEMSNDTDPRSFIKIELPETAAEKVNLSSWYDVKVKVVN